MLSSSELRRTTPGSDHFLGNPRRSSIILLALESIVSRSPTFDSPKTGPWLGVSRSQLIFNHLDMECFTQIQSFTELACWLKISPPLLALKPFPPTKVTSGPITVLSEVSRHSENLNSAAKRKLGFGRLGLLKFGPVAFSFWPIYKGDGTLPILSRPMSVFKLPLVNSNFGLNIHTLIMGRRLLLLCVSFLVQDLIIQHSLDLKHVSLFDTLWVSFISEVGLRNRHVFFYLRAASSMEKFTTFSSSSEERSITIISLLLRGEPSLQFALKSFSTILHSCVMVYTGPKDATEFIPVRTEVVNFVQSHMAK